MLLVWGASDKMLQWAWQPNQVVILGRGTQHPPSSLLMLAPDDYPPGLNIYPSTNSNTNAIIHVNTWSNFTLWGYHYIKSTVLPLAPLFSIISSWAIETSSMVYFFPMTGSRDFCSSPRVMNATLSSISSCKKYLKSEWGQIIQYKMQWLEKYG